MSTVLVKRLPRRPAPDIPTGELAVDPPPEIPQNLNSRWQQGLQLLLMMTGGVATALMFAGRGGGTYTLLVGGMFGVSMLGMMISSMGGLGPKKSEMIAARREYLRHLAGLRRRVRETANRQRIGLFYRHPDPQALWSTVASFRLWERRPADADFGIVRVAVGPQTLATPLLPPVTRPLDELEPMTAGALRRFLDAYSVVPDLPVAVSVRGFARVFVRSSPGTPGGGGRGFEWSPGGAGRGARLRGPDWSPESSARRPEHGGDPPDPRGLVRAILAQLAVFHAPDDLLIAVCTSPERRAEWEWVKWLPHGLHPSKTDASGPIRLVATTAAELEDHLDDLIANRPRFNPNTGYPRSRRRSSWSSTAASCPAASTCRPTAASRGSRCSIWIIPRRGCSNGR